MSSIIQSAILRHVQEGGNPQAITKRVMDELHASKLISYDDPSKPSLLTVNGRVLYLLMENTDISLREIAVRCGVTESSAQRAISTLAEGKLIKRRKVKGKNRYEIQRKAILDNPDFLRYHLSAEEFLNE